MTQDHYFESVLEIRLQLEINYTWEVAKRISLVPQAVHASDQLVAGNVCINTQCGNLFCLSWKLITKTLPRCASHTAHRPHLCEGSILASVSLMWQGLLLIWIAGSLLYPLFSSHLGPSICSALSPNLAITHWPNAIATTPSFAFCVILRETPFRESSSSMSSSQHLRWSWQTARS